MAFRGKSVEACPRCHNPADGGYCDKCKWHKPYKVLVTDKTGKKRLETRF